VKYCPCSVSVPSSAEQLEGSAAVLRRTVLAERTFCTLAFQCSTMPGRTAGRTQAPGPASVLPALPAHQDRGLTQIRQHARCQRHTCPCNRSTFIVQCMKAIPAQPSQRPLPCSTVITRPTYRGARPALLSCQEVMSSSDKTLDAVTLRPQR